MTSPLSSPAIEGNADTEPHAATFSTVDRVLGPQNSRSGRAILLIGAIFPWIVQAAEQPPRDQPEPAGVAEQLTGAQVVHTTDWESVQSGSPIPEQMPTAQSDDPLEAGFARQWITRSLSAWPQRQIRDWALAVVSKRRVADDIWAYQLEHQLREFIRMERDIDPGHPFVSRVFCNSVGCLCYVESHTSFADKTASLYGALQGDVGKKFAISSEDISRIAMAGPEIGHSPLEWTLVVIKRNQKPRTTNPAGESR